MGKDMVSLTIQRVITMTAHSPMLTFMVYMEDLLTINSFLNSNT